MTKKITIALDCMGGDNAPQIVIKGAQIVASSNPNIHFLLYGNSSLIKPLLENCPQLKKNHTLFHTDQSVSSDEKPSIALRKGTKSSMRLAINAVKHEECDAMVSAGNTGALMAMSKIVLRSLPSIDRPAIVSCIPNQKKKATVMLDMGANVDCNSEVLYQFAIMGYAFAKTVLGIEKPSIGLLNIGSEDLAPRRRQDHADREAVKNAAELIKESDLADAFYGYVEGDDICKGTVDVVVTDGFCGNITLKAIEGAAKMVAGIVKAGFMNSILAKIGYLFAKTSLDKMFKRVDPRLHNGAMLVGLNGIVVKSHGGTDEVGFANAIKVAISLTEDN
ncbi:MAG: phosphate acyltransferase PlsX, partial [Proteobacteria bacterium]|nr:phosphate acyltransferase PlsX [Pseudomonadota bacterium]